MDNLATMNFSFSEILPLICKANKLDAILAYIKNCKYSPEKKIIFAIAGESYEGDD